MFLMKELKAVNLFEGRESNNEIIENKSIEKDGVSTEIVKSSSSSQKDIPMNIIVEKKYDNSIFQNDFIVARGCETNNKSGIDIKYSLGVTFIVCIVGISLYRFLSSRGK
jgi:hypothetical protein